MGWNLSNSKPLGLFSRSLPALNRGLPTSILYQSSPLLQATSPSLPGSELASSAPAALSSSTTPPPRDHSLKEAERERRPKAPGGRDDDKRGSTGDWPCHGLLHSATRNPFPPPSCPTLLTTICPPVPQIFPSLLQTVPPPRPFTSDRQSPHPMAGVSFYQATPFPRSTTTHCR